MSTSQENSRQGIVITGTSRGIGYHLAQRFLKEGYRVIGINRTKTLIKHPNFRCIQADVADLKQVESLTSLLAKEPVVGLINNAGIHGPIGRFEDTPIDAWVGSFNVNLFGAAALSQICVPSLRRNKGFILFLSGGGSAFPRPNYSAYSVSKCGVIRLSEVLAKELEPEVLVYCVAPGPNRTQMQDEVIQSGETVREEDFVDFSSPENLCLFLAQNKDARYSGKFIHVKDDYTRWDDQQLAPDANTLRRLDTRTLARFVRH